MFPIRPGRFVTDQFGTYKCRKRGFPTARSKAYRRSRPRLPDGPMIAVAVPATAHPSHLLRDADRIQSGERDEASIRTRAQPRRVRNGNPTSQSDTPAPAVYGHNH